MTRNPSDYDSSRAPEGLDQDIRAKLLESLVAIERAQYAMDYFTAFVLLKLYLGGPSDGGDEELRLAFQRAQRAIEERTPL